tara:strand:+ start:362 stop:781 length:420 start_codon:yes stop_codon:yes gene_type:complete
LAEWVTSKKLQITSKKNFDEIELLKNLNSTGTWYLDLTAMNFLEMSEKIYDIYGVGKETPPGYEDLLFNYVFIEDQFYVEQKRLEITHLQGSPKILFEFWFVQQETEAIHKERTLVQRVEDEDGNLTGLRGASKDLGPI